MDLDDARSRAVLDESITDATLAGIALVLAG
jgi:hypothetical protein